MAFRDRRRVRILQRLPCWKSSRIHRTEILVQSPSLQTRFSAREGLEADWKSRSRSSIFPRPDRWMHIVLEARCMHTLSRISEGDEIPSVYRACLTYDSAGVGDIRPTAIAFCSRARLPEAER